MKKVSSIWSITTLIWMLALAINLLNQDFSHIQTSDYIQHGLFLATIIASFLAYFNERKKERVND